MDTTLLVSSPCVTQSPISGICNTLCALTELIWADYYDVPALDVLKIECLLASFFVIELWLATVNQEDAYLLAALPKLVGTGIVQNRKQISVR